MSTPRRRTSSPAKGHESLADKKLQFDDVTQSLAHTLTTNQGLAIPDNHNSSKAGEHGPTLLEDFILREKLAHFDHERIPERVVYARGAGAHGVFKVYKSLVQYTSAAFLQNPEVETPVFVRFSSAAGSTGSADTVRDVRGFAVKFYTQQGNYDLVGNNMPVFFIQDAMKFPDLIHAWKPEPHHGMPQASSAHDTYWDFVSLMPESTHMLMWTMSDRALPRSLRMMEGFGVHTFRLINARGGSHFVKFHWKPKLGVHALAADEAQKIAGKDPDFHRRDLWESIAAGHFPEWELGVQIIDAGKEGDLGIDILDPTKLIPESLVPVQIVGKLTLNRNPDNFFAETEQIAFNPGHLVPGIDFSNDPLLQGRLFSYSDSQFSRLGGANFHELAINRGVCPVHNFQRDGLHRQIISKGRVSYEPNTLGNSSEFRIDGAVEGFQSQADEIDSPKTRRRPAAFDDHFSQATLFWNSQSAGEKEHIVAAFRYELSKVDVPEIRQRVVDNLAHVDSRLAVRVATGLGINAPDPRAAAGRLGFRTGGGAASGQASKINDDPALRMSGRTVSGNGTDSIKTRRVAVLVANGVDFVSVKRLLQDLADAGASCKLISAQLGSISTTGNRQLAVEGTFSTAPSVLFDAVVLPGGEASNSTLSGWGDAVHFVLEAYKHGKTICAVGDGAQLLATLGFTHGKNPEVTQQPTAGVLMADARRVADGALSQELIACLALHRHWDRVNLDAIPG